ncbi:MAG: hypothetical protein AAGA65_28875 [Actinomycetota bacterium]
MVLPPVADQFTAFAGGGDPPPCEPEIWQQPIPSLPYVGLGFGASSTAAGQFASLCFIGFEDSEPLEATFTLPDRSTVVSVLPLDSNFLWNQEADLFTDSFGRWGETLWWLVLPTHQRGDYGVEVTQSDTRATGSFAVVNTDDPWLESVTKFDPIAPGGTVTVVLSGFEPDQLVPIGLYTHNGGEEFELHSDVGAFPVDASGVGVVRVPADLPSGRYCVATPLIEVPECSVAGVFYVG